MAFRNRFGLTRKKHANLVNFIEIKQLVRQSAAIIRKL